MSDLSKILGGPWTPPPEKRIDPPEVQLRDAMISAGLTPPDDIYMDGKVHRFKSGTKGSPGKGDKPGWYLVFGDGVPAGRFGCWRSGLELPWRADVGRKLTQFEEMAHAKRMAEAKALRDAELERKHEVAASTVEMIWSGAHAASPEHEYLKRKGIGVHGARNTGDGRLVLPLYDANGKLASLQYIDQNGGKLYHSGGKTGGNFWMLGTMDEPGVLYVAEGFATAASIYEVTNRPCVVSYSASNLVPVTGTMRELYGIGQEIVIVADNDESGVGQRYAEQACAKYGARMVMPPERGDANDYVQEGHDLAALLMPQDDGWLIPADDFSAQPAPISWLVKRWVQDQALVMVHGPSGGGKTFVVLDWCLRMAAGVEDWHGHRVRGGDVVYLAGEGHHGLRGRIAAWKHQNKAGALSMWLSKDGCDLNTPTGYLKVVEQVRRLPRQPKAIVVDTLHRFLLGDENSAQDAKTMLDACNQLMLEFQCSVILVHHTGVSDEAQHRARGSSAWRGALDIEISIVPSKGDQPMQIVQRKSKDAELAQPVYVELQSVEIPGWKDEDGQPVTSAVVIEAATPVEAKIDSPLTANKKRFERAWFAIECEMIDDLPYISRSAMIDFLISHDGFKERQAENMCKPDGKFIGEMLQAGLIATSRNGWVVTNDLWITSMTMVKNSAV